MKYLLLLFALNMILAGCKKANDSNIWKVKYEVTSTNANTKLQLIYRDETGNVVSLGSFADPTGTYKSTPWTYEANFSKDAGMLQAKLLLVNVVDAINFSSSDIVTAKIYVDGALVNQNSTPNGVTGIQVTYQLP